MTHSPSQIPVYYFLANNSESCPELSGERLLTTVAEGESFEGLSVIIIMILCDHHDHDHNHHRDHHHVHHNGYHHDHRHDYHGGGGGEF